MAAAFGSEKKVKVAAKANDTLEDASSCLFNEPIAEIEFNQLAGSSLGTTTNRKCVVVLKHVYQANIILGQLNNFSRGHWILRYIWEVIFSSSQIR